MHHPIVENAPGLKWRKLKKGWQAMWRARSDLVAKGYNFKLLRLWQGVDPNEMDKLFIADRCQLLQDDMMTWARGGIPELGAYDKTWAGLVRAYRTDPDSTYHKKRYVSRLYYDKLCKRIVQDCGADLVGHTDARRLLRLHEQWSAGGKVTMGHAMIGMLRTITTFGSTLLKCPDCKAIRSDLHDMRVKSGKPREDALTADQAIAIRHYARTMDKPRPSVSLAQAFQFDCTMRQKDVLGEWVPLDEVAPPTDVFSGNEKWVRGLRAEEIDANLILRHMTSKRDKMLVIDLKIAPMVVEEFKLLAGLGPDDELRREHIQANGPLVVNERTGKPWSAHSFRPVWRDIARKCEIPDAIRSMDSRAGAITEAFASGASPDAIRKGATHSNLSMTQRYSRGDAAAVVDVMQHRATHRNRDKNGA